jgi:hypothetical protein
MAQVTFEEFCLKLPNQVSFLEDPKTKLLISLDRILRFETLEKDFHDMCIQWNLPLKLPVYVKGDYDHDLSKWYNHELYTQLLPKFKADMEYFHYSFPGDITKLK